VTELSSTPELPLGRLGVRRGRDAEPSVAATAVRSFGALLLRDVTVEARDLVGFLLRTLVQPGLFVFVFAYLFPRIGQGVGAGAGSGSGDFASVVITGLVASTAVFTGVSTVSLPLSIEFGATREIEDRIMAPLPVWAVGAEKILFGAAQSLFAAALVLPLGLLLSATPVTIAVQSPLLLVAVALLASLTSGALGLVIGTIVRPEKMGLVFAALVVPLTFLGCVYYPWSELDVVPWMQIGVLINPLVYMSEGVRAALTPEVTHMPEWAFLGVGLAFLVVLWVMALRLFARRVAT
jgi:ABC-2 type transport system permease protein